MENLKYTRNGNELTITVLDITADLGPSASGKSQIVAGTGGFVAVEGAGVSFAVNVIRPKVKGK